MEQKKVTGRVDSIFTQEGNTNGKDWKRYEIHVDGFKYSTFDAEMVKEVKQGDLIELDLEKSDKYWQIKGLRKLEEKVGEAQEQSQPTSADSNPTYLEKPKQNTKHLVLAGLESSEFKTAMDKACEENNVFASQTHIENGKWFAVLFLK